MSELDASELGDGHEELSETAKAVLTHDSIVSKLIERLNKHVDAPTEEAFIEDTFLNRHLRDCVFVGHLATDLDSIAGAMGAAALFGGVATKSERELNGEIAYALSEVAEMEEPPLFDELPGAGIPDENGEYRCVCLVDHNEDKQMVKSLRDAPDRKRRIVGLIDHHAVGESFSSETPLLIDVRPWGSMSSIVAHLYIRNNARMSKGIARMLMCAILSDTLNLQSVTTTDADRFAVALLAKWGSVEDPDDVARLMFRAKTKWMVNLGAYSMVRGDQKDYSATGWKLGIAVCEVTDMEPVLAKASEIIIELRVLKKDKGGGVRENELDFAFLFVVDVVRQCSVLIVCGGREFELAKVAFPGCPFGKANEAVLAPGSTIKADQTLCDVGPLVSRKAQFVPAFLRVLNEGFNCHREPVAKGAAHKQGDEDDRLDEVLKEGNATVFVDSRQNLRRHTAIAFKAVFGVEEPAQPAEEPPVKMHALVCADLPSVHSTQKMKSEHHAFAYKVLVGVYDSVQIGRVEEPAQPVGSGAAAAKAARAQPLSP